MNPSVFAPRIDSILGPAVLSGIPADSRWRATLASVRPEPGVEELVVSLEADGVLPPPRCALSLRVPIRDAVSCWTPQHVHFEMPLPWTKAEIGANAARDLPLYANVGPDGASRFVLACSECVRRVAFRGVVDEFGSDEEFTLTFFAEPEEPLSRWSARVRLDLRRRPFHEALRDGADWIRAAAAPFVAAPLPVPEAARRPWYSTWYAYHHELSTGAVLAEARAARRLGMRGLLLDSGWDLRRPKKGFAPENPSKIGDWIPAAAKIPDMAELVRGVHREGLAFALWYALPFVGEHSRAWAKWCDRMLWVRPWGGGRVGILDPRFPEVREHLASLLARAVRDWGLDGLKLDFIDSWERRDFAPSRAPGAETAPNLPVAAAGAAAPSASSAAVPPDGRDLQSVPQAVVRCLDLILRRVRAVRPDILVEFRQGYVGPAVLPYCNMVRASDCPSCIATNRIKTVDLRLTSAPAVVHGDMLEWDLSGTAEEAALQFLATLFAVPQVSVRLADLPPRHRAMLRFWLRFWNAHRDTLLGADFRPLHPEGVYPVVAAASAGEAVSAVYQSGAVADVWPNAALAGFVANATSSDRLVLRFSRKPKSVEVFDCAGRRVAESAPRHAGLCEVAVPPAGLLAAR